MTFSGSRSSQQVTLEEDYFKDITYTERVPVTRNVCQDIPVTQNYCEWIPGQRICQTRPICHPTPYGQDVCRPMVVMTLRQDKSVVQLQQFSVDVDRPPLMNMLLALREDICIVAMPILSFPLLSYQRIIRQLNLR